MFLKPKLAVLNKIIRIKKQIQQGKVIYLRVDKNSEIEMKKVTNINLNYCRDAEC